MYRDSLVPMADSCLSYRFVIKNIAAKRGLIASIMPKPIFGDNASGMHVSSSLWKGSKNAFYDSGDSYAELSQIGRYYVGGLLSHSRALTAITNPTTNSYRRLVPGYEAPVYIAWSKANRSANVRIPVYHKGASEEKRKRAEFRTPDPSANPYLAFAAISAAGLDGIKKKIDPGNPVNEDIYKLTPEKRRSLRRQGAPGEPARVDREPEERLELPRRDLLEGHGRDDHGPRDDQLQAGLREAAPVRVLPLLRHLGDR